MRPGLPISLLLHAGLISAGLLALPVPQLNLADAPPVVPVDLVTLAKKTNIKASAPPTKKQTEITLPPVLKAPKPKAPEPEKAVRLPPEPKAKKPKAAPKPKPKPKTTQKHPVKKPPKPAPPAFDLARLETRLARRNAPDQPETPKESSLDRTREAIGEGTAMTANELDLLRAQMYRCWRAPLDAPDPGKLKVTVRARLNADGTLAAMPKVLNQGQINRSGDAFWRAASANALRAVIKCQPYHLPAEKYALWRETIMHFDATDELGQ